VKGGPPRPKCPATDSAAVTGILDLPPEPLPPTRPLERALRLFSDVREDEGPRLLALTVNVFLILVAYYVMKPVREVLILNQPGGAELKSYAYAAKPRCSSYWCRYTAPWPRDFRGAS
jgi:AAA family ATP:ADP antiporter